MENYLRSILNKYSALDNIWQTWIRSGNFIRLELKNVKWKNNPADKGCAYVPTSVSIFDFKSWRFEPILSATQSKQWNKPCIQYFAE